MSMPQVECGAIVLWYEGGVKDDERACPAIVKVSSHSSLHLRVFGQDKDFDQTCVRHIDDPTAREYDFINEGAWDFKKSDRQSKARSVPQTAKV